MKVNNMRAILVLIPLLLSQTAFADAFLFNSASTPLVIPDGTSFATATISVGPGSGFTTINDLNVLVDIDHTFTGDLDIFLDHVESATTVHLFDNYGGGGDDITMVTFDDEAAALISSVSSPFGPGEYRPNSAENPLMTSLSVFDGGALDGTWTLRVIDGFGGDSGTIQGFSILGDANISTVPEPSSFALLTLGGLGYWGVRRRRFKQDASSSA